MRSGDEIGGRIFLGLMYKIQRMKSRPETLVVFLRPHLKCYLLLFLSHKRYKKYICCRGYINFRAELADTLIVYHKTTSLAFFVSFLSLTIPDCQK